MSKKPSGSVKQMKIRPPKRLKERLPKQFAYSLVLMLSRIVYGIVYKSERALVISRDPYAYLTFDQ